MRSFPSTSCTLAWAVWSDQCVTRPFLLSYRVYPPVIFLLQSISQHKIKKRWRTNKIFNSRVQRLLFRSFPFSSCTLASQPLHPPSIFVGNSPYLRGTKFVPQHDMTSFDKFFLDWSKVQRSKLRQLCSFELFLNLWRIRGYEEHALVRAYTSSSTTCPPIGGTHRKNIIEVALRFRFTVRPT